MLTSKKHELLQYVGDLCDVYGVTDYTFNDGKRKGVRALDVKNGKGMEFTVLPDRCLDIPHLSCKGVNLAFRSKTGIVAPQYYVEDGRRGFLRSFNGGFLTTCGLTHCGSPCIEDGVAYGLHGPIGNTPAKNVCASVQSMDGVETVVVSGEVTQACVFGENLKLTRTYACSTERNAILLPDVVENLGFDRQPLMHLWHINLGYPLLGPVTRLYTSADRVAPYDDAARKGIDRCDEFEAPTPGCEEQVFFYTCDTGVNERFAMAHNPELSLAVALKYDVTQSPWLMEWKCMKAGDYALGLEPGNCHVLGRDKARADGTLQFIEPGASARFDLEVLVLDEPDEIGALIAQSKKPVIA